MSQILVRRKSDHAELASKDMPDDLDTAAKVEEFKRAIVDPWVQEVMDEENLDDEEVEVVFGPKMFGIAGSCMTEVHARPPVWADVTAILPVNEKTCLFTFGDLMYNPGGQQIPPDFIRHEEEHAEQQGHTNEGAAEWWRRWLAEPYFRMDQEARAYAAQWDWWCRRNKTKRMLKLHDLAATLASPLYGGLVTHNGARDLIKGYSTQTK